MTEIFLGTWMKIKAGPLTFSDASAVIKFSMVVSKDIHSRVISLFTPV